MPPCWMANRAWPGLFMKASLERCAQAFDLCIACLARFLVAGYSMHSSKIMVMVAPSLC